MQTDTRFPGFPGVLDTLLYFHPVLVSRPTDGRRLSWPEWLITCRGGIHAKQSPISVLIGMDVRRRVTSLMLPTPLPLHHAATLCLLCRASTQLHTGMAFLQPKPTDRETDRQRDRERPGLAGAAADLFCGTDLSGGSTLSCGAGCSLTGSCLTLACFTV